MIKLFWAEFKSKFDLQPLEGIRRQCLEWDRPDPDMHEEFLSPIECYHTLNDLPLCGLALADGHDIESEFWWKSVHVEFMFMSKYDSDFMEWLDAKEKYEMTNDAVSDDNNDACTWHAPMSLHVRVLHMGEDAISMTQAMDIAKQFPGVISAEYKRLKIRIQCARSCSIDALCSDTGKNCKKYIHSVNAYDFPD